MQIFIHKNPRLLQFLFLLILVGLLFASCKSSKNISSDNSKSENKEVAVSLKDKYSVKLGVPKKELDNVALLKFIDEWYGVPYKHGGKDKSGVDCSAFSSQLEKTVFKKEISGSAQGLFDQCKEAKVASLKEGDLVFFKIDSKKVSHVGVYIMNNKFVHATTKKGVMINDLNEKYYQKYFYAAGRIK